MYEFDAFTDAVVTPVAPDPHRRTKARFADLGPGVFFFLYDRPGRRTLIVNTHPVEVPTFARTTWNSVRALAACAVETASRKPQAAEKMRLGSVAPYVGQLT